MASDPLDAPGLAALFAGDYALALLVAIPAWALGRRITRRVPYASAAEAFAYSGAAGLGAVALLVFGLGALGLLRKGPLLVLLTAALAAGAGDAWRALRGAAARAGGRAPGGKARLAVACAALLALAIAIPILLLPLYPPTQWDATGYHLPYAKAHARAGRLAFDPLLRYPTFPQLNEMLFTAALLFGDDRAAQVLELCLLAALIAGCWAFGARHASPRAAAWGAALALGSSQVVWLGTIAYVDLGLAAFAALGVFAFWNWRSSGQRPWLVLSGALLGMAAGTKYLGLVAAGLVGLVAIADAARARRAGPVLLFAGAAALAASPWYIRNAALTGNPVFPFLPELFGHAIWNAEDHAWLANDIITHRGVGRSLRALLALPWHLVAHQRLFDAEERISPLFGIGLALAPFVAWRARGFRLLYAVGVGYLLVWFYSAQILRYLTPALPILAVAMAATADRALPRWRPARAAGWLLAAVIALLLAAPGLLHAARTLREWGPPPADAPARERFIARIRPSYPAYAYLNATRGRDYAVYAYREQCMTYFAEGRFLGDYFGPSRYSIVDSRWEDGEALYEALHGLGATHLLVSSWYGKISIPPDDAFHRRFRLVWGRANTALFELSDPPRERVLGPDRLENGGLERLEGGAPAAWALMGDASADVSAAQSAGGAVAVRCRGGGASLVQSTGVSAGEPCFLRCRARGEGGPQRAALFISWFREDGGPLGTEVEVSGVTPAWRGIRMLVTAPEGAAYANVGAGADTSSVVWFDDLYFSGFGYR